MTPADQPFIDAICREPEDMALRLIYADFLEERGDQRGEFIRIQCQFADPSPCPQHGWDENCADNNASALRRRERELLTEHGTHWLGFVEGTEVVNDVERNEMCVAYAFHTGDYFSHAYFRRGFVEAVTCRLVTEWIGEECHHCHGRGWITHPESGMGTHCHCHGTGHIDAHGPAIVQACPVREVRSDFVCKLKSDALVAWARQAAGLTSARASSTPSRHHGT